MSNLPSQEFKLFRVCLGITFTAAVIFIPLQRIFISSTVQPALFYLYLFCMVFCLALFKFIDARRLRLGTILYIVLFVAVDLFALWLQPLSLRAPSFLLVFTFTVMFNLVLARWPEVAVLDAFLLLMIGGFMYLPASGFIASAANYGLNGVFAATAAMIYFVLLLTLGTALVEVKRRTENRLRAWNENLNRMVEEKVAEIQRADREARQYQEQVEKILRFSPVGVLITDENLNLLYSNGVHFRLDEATVTERERSGLSLPLTVLRDVLNEARTKAAARGEDSLLGQRLEFALSEGNPCILHYSFLRVKLWGGGRARSPAWF